MHLTANLSYPLMALLAALIFPAMLLRRGSGWQQLLAFDLPLFGVATGSVLLFYVASQVAVGEPWRARLRLLPALMATGIGLSVTNSAAVVAGALRRGGTFHRTPKYGFERNTGAFHWTPSISALPSNRDAESPAAATPAAAARHSPRASSGYGRGRRLSFWIEGALAAYFAACCLTAIALGMWLSLPFLYLFLQGYGYLFLLALRPADRPAPRTERALAVEA